MDETTANVHGTSIRLRDSNFHSMTTFALGFLVDFSMVSVVQEIFEEHE
jgi:hypothetical protein